jgi:pyroglutamyl-peptidase
MPPERLLVYGFGPYRNFRDNVTASIVRVLPKQRSVKTIVFPVRFHKAQFIGVVKRFKPDVILGLGQCSKGRLLRIETRAVNHRRSNKKVRATAIVPGGAGKLFTTLRLGKMSGARMSRNAGDYVCNYSMYVILDYVKTRRLPIRFGFVHVPHTYNRYQAALFVTKAIKKLSAQGSSG